MVRFEPISEKAWKNSEGCGAQWTCSVPSGARNGVLVRGGGGGACRHSVRDKGICGRGALRLINNPNNPHVLRAADTDLEGKPCQKIKLEGSDIEYYVTSSTAGHMDLLPMHENYVGPLNEGQNKGNNNNYANSALRTANENTFANLHPEVKKDVVTDIRENTIVTNEDGEVISGDIKHVAWEYTQEQREIVTKALFDEVALSNMTKEDLQNGLKELTLAGTADYEGTPDSEIEQFDALIGQQVEGLKARIEELKAKAAEEEAERNRGKAKKESDEKIDSLDFDL